MKNQHCKACVAECLGTCTLASAVALSSGFSVPVTPLIAALVLGLFVYTVGGISGAHLNPAVTLGLLSVKKISPAVAGKYIIAQFLGGGLAALLLWELSGKRPLLMTTENIPAAGAEAVGAFMLAFGVASVAFGKVKDAASGTVVGGSLLLGITLASTFSSGVVNPAVALVTGSLSLTYILGPIVGAIIAMNLYRWLAGGK